MSKGIDLIAAERARQVSEEGYTAEHDVDHAAQLADAARVYAASARNLIEEGDDARPDAVWARTAGWPWASRFWKPTGDPVRDLVKAGALVAAAIDSLTSTPEERS